MDAEDLTIIMNNMNILNNVIAVFLKNLANYIQEKNINYKHSIYIHEFFLDSLISSHNECIYNNCLKIKKRCDNGNIDIVSVNTEFSMNEEKGQLVCMHIKFCNEKSKKKYSFFNDFNHLSFDWEDDFKSDLIPKIFEIVEALFN